MKFKKITAGILAGAMAFGAVPAYSVDSPKPEITAEAAMQYGTVNVSIDQKTVTVDEAKAGVLLYIRVNTPLLNAIEFGTHVDGRCNYTVIRDNSTLSYVPGDNENLDVHMTVKDSNIEKNMTWYAYAADMPDEILARSYENGTFSCMNLAALYISVPEEYAVPGAHFDVQYLSSGVIRSDGKASHEIWSNTYTGSDDYGYGIQFYAQDYVELGMVNAQDGWIEIESLPETTTTTTTTTTKTEQKTRGGAPTTATGKKEIISETSTKRRNEGTGSKTETRTEKKTTNTGARGGQTESSTTTKTTTRTTSSKPAEATSTSTTTKTTTTRTTKTTGGDGGAKTETTVTKTESKSGDGAAAAAGGASIRKKYAKGRFQVSKQ